LSEETQRILDLDLPAVLSSKFAPEWRNWYTHQTQNLAGFTSHVGSSPTFGTNPLALVNENNVANREAFMPS
jgi:hypothetical protein